jgi:hypothetical protein
MKDSQVARGSSKSSGSTRNRRDNAETTAPVEDTQSPDAIEAPTEQADSSEARTTTDEAPAAAADVVEQDSAPATDADETTSPQPDGLAGDDSVTGAKDEVEEAEVVLEPGDGSETLATPEPEPTRPTPPPAPQNVLFSMMFREITGEAPLCTRNPPPSFGPRPPVTVKPSTRVARETRLPWICTTGWLPLPRIVVTRGPASLRSTTFFPWISSDSR